MNLIDKIWESLLNLLVLPSAVDFDSAATDDLVNGAEQFSLFLQFFQLFISDVCFHLGLQEDIIDLVVFSSSSSPVGQVVAALDAGEGDSS